MDVIQAKKLAEELLEEHGLSDWKVVFIDAPRSKYGHCDYTKKEIALDRTHARTHSKHYVRGTILHEIAHALTPKNCKSHGPEWQCQARALGLTGERMQTHKSLVAANKRRRARRTK